MNIQEFIEDLKLSIVVRRESKSRFTTIYKGTNELDSYSMFEQFVLYCSFDELSFSIGEKLPRVWIQGNTVCCADKKDEELILIFFENVGEKQNITLKLEEIKNKIALLQF